MEVALTDPAGGTSPGSVELADEAFGAPFNEPLVHQVVTAYFAGARRGTKAQKSRAEVRGGGRKPWRQKGTGRARAGSIRSPIWRGGGVTFAARPRSYAQKVNKKMYRGALRSIFSELLRTDRLVVVDGLELPEPRTKLLVELLEGLELRDVLIITDGIDENLELAARNLHWAAVLEMSQVNPPSLIAFEKVLITRNALKYFEGRLA